MWRLQFGCFSLKFKMGCERPSAAFGGSPPREGETRAQRARGSLTHHLELQLPWLHSFAAPRGKSFFVPLSRFIRFPPTRATQDVLQRIVVLVAGVFINRFICCRPRVLTRPWPRPSCRIFDRKAIQQRIRGDARESLDHMHVFGRPSESCLVCEVRRVDDERLSFPVADRVAHPFANCF